MGLNALIYYRGRSAGDMAKGDDREYSRDLTNGCCGEVKKP